MKIETISVLFLAVLLASCALVSTSVPVEVLSATFSQTPMPPAAVTVSITSVPAAKLERWMEYENALAATFLPLPYLPGKGLCEWEILVSVKE
jgi:hypothetical protein